MLKVWSVINYIFVHWTKKLTLVNFKKCFETFRHGPGAMATSAVVGGILLGMIEGLGILMNKWQSESFRPVDPRLAPQDPSLLGPDPSGNKSFQWKNNRFFFDWLIYKSFLFFIIGPCLLCMELNTMKTNRSEDMAIHNKC